MNDLDLRPAVAPTMYFIGVSTSRSMIMRVFPAWARRLGFGECRIQGIDLPLHDAPERYRRVVRFIKEDPLSLGALVTTHKIDLCHAAADLFDGLDGFASLMGEVSSISKKDGRLLGAAKDPVTSGLALDAFLPQGHWQRTAADAFIMGAGGASVALSFHLMDAVRGADRPARLFVSNRSPGRLEEMKEIHRKMRESVPDAGRMAVEYALTPEPRDNDAVMARLSPGSLVVNGTGLGKDGPGSPLTDAAPFPRAGWAWDFNYRGDLVFLRQAAGQEENRGLRVVDGWLYFIYGWLAVISDVFHGDIPPRGPVFDDLCRIAAEERGRQ